MILDRIREHFPQLSDAKQRVAAYIVNNWQEVAFLSVAQLARAANVSESVVVRFANDVGYSGYPQLQEEIRDLVKHELGLVDMYRRSAREDQSETRQLIDRVMTNDVSNLTRTLELLQPTVVDQAVERLLAARYIAVLASRSSAGPGLILALYLNSILGNARAYTNAYGELFDELRMLGADDLVVAISFAWYTQQTIEALEFCRERRTKAIAITDSLTSPLARLADITLIARPEGVSFYVSQVAALGLVNVLLYLVAMRAKERSVQSLQEMEKIYSRFYVPRPKEKSEG